LFAKLIHTFQDDFETMMLVQSIILFAVLVGPTIFLGATFPLVSRIYARSVPAIGRSIGSAYALNTVGAILGSFAAGFVLIPWVGKDGGLWLVIAFQFMVAFLALMQPEVGLQKKGWRRRRLVGMLSAVLGILCLSYYPSWNRSVLSRGWYRNFQDIENALDRTSWWDAFWRGSALLAQQREGIELAFYGDGIGGFTTVEKETTSLGTVEYALYNSGKPDASSHGDRSTQTLSGHVPLLFHPAPEKVMVLGLASGMTPGEVLLYPVKQLDILEINEQVVDACRSFFTPWNNACLSDPRTRLIVQDGRNHLALTREKYDVIISEPSNPWMAGLANLYTLDFFRLVRERLRDQGIFAQWIQSYEMDWDTFSLLGRTFAEVFPKGAMFKVGPVDYLLLGFRGEKGLDWAVAEGNSRYARRSTNVSFARASFLVHLVMTEDLRGLFGSGPVHTDNRPHLEFAAPTKLYGATLDVDLLVAPKRRLSAHTDRFLQANSDPDTLLDLIEFGGSANVPLFSMLHLGTLTPSQKGRYSEIVKSFCSQSLVPSYHVFAESESKKTCAEIHAAKIEQKLAQGNPRSQDHYNLGLALIAAGRGVDAAEEFRQTMLLQPLREDAYTALGLLLAEAGRLKEAVGYLSRAVELAPLDADTHKNLAMAEARLGNLENASMHLRAAVAILPHDVVTLNELGSVLLRQGKVGEAIDRYSAALSLAPEDAESHHNLGMALFKQGKLEEALRHFSEALRISPDNANVRYNVETVSRLLDQSSKGTADSG
jgi:spermidine synthase